MYIDDILLIAQSPEILKQYTLTTLDLLEALGHLVNYPKPQLTHTQSTTLPWFVVNCKLGNSASQFPKDRIIQREA